jgi:2-dehydropantoate 2-reductase
VARIALIGPGAIGGTVAAWLAHAGRHDVTICTRTPFDRLVVETPEGTIDVAPRVLTRAEEAEPADWVLAAMKAYDSDAAAPWLERLAGPETRLAVLQNGIEHKERFASMVDPARIVPVIVELPAERTAPGRLLQRELGRLVVPDDDAGRDFVALFEGVAIKLHASSHFAAVAWRKLAFNAAGAVNALALQPARIAHDPEVAETMRGLAAETIAVARAEGVDLPDSLADAIAEGYRAAAPDSLNSLHADRLAGRPMEWNARNGVVVRLGRKHGIATPLNQMAAAMLKAAEDPGG